jgi:tRNA (Thr-GGU) A37 N-methylase
MAVESIELWQIGRVESALRSLHEAPRQGDEGGPDAWLQMEAPFTTALRDIRAGDDLLIITWLHLADRSVLETHPQRPIDTADWRVRDALSR